MMHVARRLAGVMATGACRCWAPYDGQQCEAVSSAEPSQEAPGPRHGAVAAADQPAPRSTAAKTVDSKTGAEASLDTGSGSGQTEGAPADATACVHAPRILV